MSNRGKEKLSGLVKTLIKTASLTALMISFLLFAVPKVYANEPIDPRTNTPSTVIDDTSPTDPTVETDPNLTGSQDERTNIREPGASEDADELSELNIANTVTIQYDNGNGTINGALRILIILTLIALAPLLLIMMTSFTRIIVVLHFTRAAIATQTAPPNQVLLGLALFLTFFIMQPTLTQAYNEGVLPFERGQITQEEAFERGMAPIRTFMYRQTQVDDVRMFMDIAGSEWDGELDSIPNTILVPSFLVSELRTAFIIGFLLYVPFIVIDMVIASVLMSMGMMMLPPTTISMPFKILLFVLADGWNLILGNLVRTFY